MNGKKNIREVKRELRHKRIRKKLAGTTERPRLCVHRSLNNFYSQMIDDQTGKVLFGVSTLNKDLKKKIGSGGNVKAAEVLGAAMAEAAKKKGISKVSFDRSGYIFHGRVKAFAQAARDGGLEF